MIDMLHREYEKFAEPAELKKHGNGRVIAMCSQKGGVGKTTSTISLAGALAEIGRKVLIVDFDPQGAASVGLGVNAYNEAEVPFTILDLLNDKEMDPHKAIFETTAAGVDIIPANIDLAGAEVSLVNAMAREFVLKGILEKVRAEYDCILIDCQPSLGLLTVNALAAADGVLIPLATEYFAMRGVALLVDTINQVKQTLNPKLEIDGLFATLYDPRTMHAQEVIESINQAFKDKLLHTAIKRTVKFPDSTVAAVSIIDFAPTSPAAENYRLLARELISRGAIK